MSVIVDFLRLLSSWIDLGLYSLAGFIYKVFCAVAESQIVKTEDVATFAERMYVVVGVFMLFKVGISMLKYLVNPDQLTDSKVGYGKLINNIAWALVILVSVPTIYNFAMGIQSAVIKSNIIPKVIFGKTAGTNADMVDAGDQMIFTTLSAFVMPNYLVTDKEGNYVALDSESVQNCFNTDSSGGNKGITNYEGLFTMTDGSVTGLTSSCETAFGELTDDESVNMYLSATENANIQQLLDVTVDAKLNDDIQEAAGRGGSFATKLYFLKYMWGISWLVGAFLCFIFTTFCIDMGIRSIKLTFLIMIAPIPVLSMINPDKGAKGMLGEWWKVTFATYLDVFLRIASVFFIIFIIQQVDLTTAIASEYGPIVSAFAMVFIIIGALLFAKQLPDLVSKLIPGMDSIVKGGFNPLKKLSDAPLAGKPLMAGAAKLNAMRAQNRANKRLARQEKRNAAYDNAIKNGKSRFGAALASTGIARGIESAKSGMSALNQQIKDEGVKATAKQKAKDAIEGIKSAPGKALDNLTSLHDDTRGVGQEAFDATGWGGGGAKTSVYNSAAASIDKKSRQDIKKMKENSVAKAKAAETLSKVETEATAARNQEIQQKEKQIVDVQREAEIQKRMQDSKYASVDASQRRAAAEADLNKELLENNRTNEIMKNAQASGQTMDEKTARAQAQNEVSKMSEEARTAAVASQGLNTSENIMNATATREASKMTGVSKEEALKAGQSTAKEMRSSAEEKVVGSLGDKMDVIAEQKGVIYNNAEYADQVKLAREAKNRRNAIQSSYEKAARQQQFEGKVTTADGRELSGQEAIDYVDKLRVDYTKASGDYDFMSKELDKMGEKYPEDAATRVLYEKEKDYQDKKKKVMKYASKSSQVSDNDRVGGQYTVEELIGEDTIVNRMRRADTESASARTRLVEQQTNLQSERRMLDAQLQDHQTNAATVTRLETEIAAAPQERANLESRLKILGSTDAQITEQLSQFDAELEQKRSQANMTRGRMLDDQALSELQAKLNVNEVELGRATVGIEKADISRENLAARASQRVSDIEVKLTELRSMTPANADEQAKVDLQISTLENALTEAKAQVDVYVSETSGATPNLRDVNISGIDMNLSGNTVHFDNIGTPIRNKVNNIIVTIKAQEAQAQTAQTVADREKATMAVESALAELEKAVNEAGDNIYRGMTDDDKAAYKTQIESVLKKSDNDGQ